MAVELVEVDYLKPDVRFRPHFIHPEVFEVALAQIKKWMTERHGVVVYQNSQMDSSRCGETSFAPRMMDTVEAGMQPAIRWLHDLPSQRQYPIDWIRPGATESATADLVDICFFTVVGRKGSKRRVRPLSKLPAPPHFPDVDGLVTMPHHVEIKLGEKLLGTVSIDLNRCAWDPYGAWIARIFTPEAYRGDGHARKGMNRLCTAADEKGVTLHIAPQSYGKMKNRDLVRWWKRLGFEKRTETGYVRYPRWKDPA